MLDFFGLIHDSNTMDSSLVLIKLLWLCFSCISCILSAEGIQDKEPNHLPTFATEVELLNTIGSMDISNVLVLSCK